MNPLLILSALATAASAQSSSASSPHDVITVPVDHRPLTRRWSGSRLESRVDRQSCGEAVIEIAYRIVAVGHRRFARIGSIRVDGRRVAPSWIAAANRALADFSDDPLIRGECVDRDYRLRLVDRAGVRPSEIRFVPLELAPRRRR